MHVGVCFPQKYDIAVVGATGAVGMEMLETLKKRNFPVGELKVYGSDRSVGRVIDTAFGPLTCGKSNYNSLSATLTSTLSSLQVSNFNSLPLTLTKLLSHFSSPTSILYLQLSNFNSLTSTLTATLIATL